MTTNISNDQQQQYYYQYYQQEQQPALEQIEEEQAQEYSLLQFSIEEYEAEESYFEEYDQEMVEAVNEADYYDFEQSQAEEEEEQQQEDYILDESLLKLIVDVQTYLAEAPNDSPLFALQYKMYTYLKQRASEMGMDIPSSII
jgi:hypothetical protein